MVASFLPQGTSLCCLGSAWHSRGQIRLAVTWRARWQAVSGIPLKWVMYHVLEPGAEAEVLPSGSVPGWVIGDGSGSLTLLSRSAPPFIVPDKGGKSVWWLIRSWVKVPAAIWYAHWSNYLSVQINDRFVPCGVLADGGCLLVQTQRGVIPRWHSYSKQNYSAKNHCFVEWMTQG